MDRRTETHARMERLFQTREAGIRMHQNRVKPAIGRRHNALLMFLLVASAPHQDVTQAANYERLEVALCFCRLQQRQQFKFKLLTSKWVKFNQQDFGVELPEQTQDLVHSRILHLHQRITAVAGDELTGRQTQWRKIDDLDRLRQRYARRQLTAIEENHAKRPRQRVCQCERTHEMSHPHRMLTIEEQSRTRSHELTSPVRSISLASFSNCDK